MDALQHTFGYRLRAAGVSFEDRQSLLGHKAAHVTTHYSAADIDPALSIVRSAGESQVLEKLAEREGLEPSTPGIIRSSDRSDHNTIKMCHKSLFLRCTSRP
jgi:hypothetical protein